MRYVLTLAACAAALSICGCVSAKHAFDKEVAADRTERLIEMVQRHEQRLRALERAERRRRSNDFRRVPGTPGKTNERW